MLNGFWSATSRSESCGIISDFRGNVVSVYNPLPPIPTIVSPVTPARPTSLLSQHGHGELRCLGCVGREMFGFGGARRVLARRVFRGGSSGRALLRAPWGAGLPALASAAGGPHRSKPGSGRRLRSGARPPAVFRQAVMAARLLRCAMDGAVSGHPPGRAQAARDRTVTPAGRFAAGRPSPRASVPLS